MASRLAIFGGIAFLLVAACASDNPPVPNGEAPGLRALTQKELKRLILGRSVRQDPGRTDVVTTRWIEQYLPRGELRVDAHRGRLTGSYRVSEARLCIALSNASERCSHFYVDSRGMYFRRGSGSEDLQPVVIQ